jgi:putative urate catabolism protein
VTSTSDLYPRNLAGYGERPPDPRWPGGARLALSVVLNWEEGAENSILHGDRASEAAVSDVTDAVPYVGMRHMRVESMFEYGSRAGVWRLLRILGERGLAATVFACGMAVERSPDVVAAMAALGHEICGHGYRWIDYQHIDPGIERGHIARTVAAIQAVTGEHPAGWYTGRDSPNTRRLVVEEGGFAYDSDDYSDDLPHWTSVEGRPHLLVPYTLDANDMRFVSASGFGDGPQFESYLRDAFDVLYDEGRSAPKMMSVGLHCRIAGRPGRAASVARFLDYARGHDGVWFATRAQIAHHWRETHPYVDSAHAAGASATG